MADASYPDELLYHPEHDWARIDGDDGDVRHHLVRPGRAGRGRLLRSARGRVDRRPRPSPTPRSSRSRPSPTLSRRCRARSSRSTRPGRTPETSTTTPTARLDGQGPAFGALRDRVAARRGGVHRPAGLEPFLVALHRRHRRRPPGDARGHRRQLGRGALRPQIPAGVRLGRRAGPPRGHGRAGRLRAPARAGVAQRLGRGRDLLPRRAACTTTTSRRSIDMLMSRSEFLTPTRRISRRSPRATCR